MKTFDDELQKIMDEYAATVDDDSTYFVKPEVKSKFNNKVKSLILETLEKSKPREKVKSFIETENLSNTEFIHDSGLIDGFNIALSEYHDNLRKAFDL